MNIEKGNTKKQRETKKKQGNDAPGPGIPEQDLMMSRADYTHHTSERKIS